MPKGTVISRERACYTTALTFLDQTYMDFSGTEVQGKQKHVLPLLEPLDHYGSQQEPILWTELVNAEYDWNKDKVESPLCVFEEDMKLSWYFNLFPELPLLPDEPESNKTKRQYFRV